MRKLGAIEAQREWLGRWCFAMTGARPSLRELSDRDAALLYQAITATADCSKIKTSAQPKCRWNPFTIPERNLGAKC